MFGHGIAGAGLTHVRHRAQRVSGHRARRSPRASSTSPCRAGAAGRRSARTGTPCWQGPVHGSGPRPATGIVSELSTRGRLGRRSKRAQRLLRRPRSGRRASATPTTPATGLPDVSLQGFRDCLPDTGIGAGGLNPVAGTGARRTPAHDLDDATLEDQLCDEKTGLGGARARTGPRASPASPACWPIAACQTHITIVPAWSAAPCIANDPNVNVAGEIDHVQVIVQWLEIIGHVWDNMLAMSGPAAPAVHRRPRPRVRLQPRRPGPLRDAARHAAGPEERAASRRPCSTTCSARRRSTSGSGKPA